MRARIDHNCAYRCNAEEMREAVSQFAIRAIAPLASKMDEKDWFPADTIWEIMGDAGLHGRNIRRRMSEPCAALLEEIVAIEEISRYSPALALAYGAHSTLCIGQLRRWGNSAQKSHYLPKLLSGEHIGAMPMSEICAEGNIMASKILARKCGDGYALSGESTGIINAEYAETFIIFAKMTDDSSLDEWTAFLICNDDRRMSVESHARQNGMRGAHFSRVRFDDYRVSKEDILGRENGGIDVLISGMDLERVIIAGIQLGMLESGLDALTNDACKCDAPHDVACRPSNYFSEITDIYLTLQRSRAQYYHMAMMHDARGTGRFDPAGIVQIANELTAKMVEDICRLLTYHEPVIDYHRSRLWRDAHILAAGTSTNEMRRTLIGRELLATRNFRDSS